MELPFPKHHLMSFVGVFVGFYRGSFYVDFPSKFFESLLFKGFSQKFQTFNGSSEYHWGFFFAWLPSLKLTVCTCWKTSFLSGWPIWVSVISSFQGVYSCYFRLWLSGFWIIFSPYCRSSFIYSKCICRYFWSVWDRYVFMVWILNLKCWLLWADVWTAVPWRSTVFFSAAVSPIEPGSKIYA